MKIKLCIQAKDSEQIEAWDFVDIYRNHGFIIKTEKLDDDKSILYAFIDDVNFNMTFEQNYENVNNVVYVTNSYERELYNFDYINNQVIIHDIDSNKIKLEDVKYKNRLYLFCKDLIKYGIITNG